MVYSKRSYRAVQITGEKKSGKRVEGNGMGKRENRNRMGELVKIGRRDFQRRVLQGRQRLDLDSRKGASRGWDKGGRRGVWGKRNKKKMHSRRPNSERKGGPRG